MYKLILPAAALVAFAFCSVTTETAQARHFRHGGVSVSIGGGGFYGGYNPGYYPGGHGCHYPSNPGWGWNGPAHSWHDTSHWDYHPTEIRRHGNHFHVQPGHYDRHQSGHWDHHHP